MKKVDIPKNGKVRVVWNVLPYDYTNDNKASVRTLFAKKYDIDESQVEVVPVVKNIVGDNICDNSDTKKELHDLCNTDNQLLLFQKFLNNYNIEGYDWETIKTIDADVNAQINYGKYDKYRKYKLKWIKWDNFLSYGEGNFFDFEKLHGLILLNGQPANQTGKTTFAIDLIHFLLFGRVTNGKADVNAKIFNKFTKCSEVKVEGCINIDGQDYVIRRTLSRPKNYTEKSTIKGSLEYFKVDGCNNYEVLKDIDSATADIALNEDNVTQTNKVIKDAIGKEEDFDLIICATAKSLDELIDKKDTERGKLMSRWLGLDVIDDKFVVAKKLHDEQTNGALCKVKNKEVLQQEIDLNNKAIQDNEQLIAQTTNVIKSLQNEIDTKTKTCDALKQSKQQINTELLSLDKETIENKLETIKLEGQRMSEEISAKKAEITEQEQVIKSIGAIEYSVDKHSEISKKYTDANIELNSLLTSYQKKAEEKKHLEASEYCPTCKQKLANIDNTKLIADCQAELVIIKKKGEEQRKIVAQCLQELEAQVELAKKNENLQKEKENFAKMQLALSALEVKLSNKRNDYKEQSNLLKEYNSNKEAIEKNANTDREIVSLENVINDYRNRKAQQESDRKGWEKDNENLLAKNNQNKKEIEQIEQELHLEANWQIYLNMLGKNGVAKMEVRELTPIINLKLKELLSEVVDFDVEVEVTEKNDVVFNLVTEVYENGKWTTVKADLTSGSGFERTCSALALRFVLGGITSIPQPNFFVIDEVLDGVASENYEKIQKLFECMLNNHHNGIDFVLHCTHIDTIKDWHKSIITINKKNRISSIAITDL